MDGEEYNQANAVPAFLRSDKSHGRELQYMEPTESSWR